MADDDRTTRDTQDNTAEERRDSGMPGGGAGRRDEVGHTGVYPLSASQGVSEDAPVVAEGAVGQGDRGIEGYQDSGDSGVIPDKELTGTSSGEEAGAGGI